MTTGLDLIKSFNRTVSGGVFQIIIPVVLLVVNSSSYDV